MNEQLIAYVEALADEIVANAGVTRQFTRYVIQVCRKEPVESFELNEWSDWHRELEDHYIDLEDAIERMSHLHSSFRHLKFKVIKRKYTLEESEIEE